MVLETESQADVAVFAWQCGCICLYLPFGGMWMEEGGTCKRENGQRRGDTVALWSQRDGYYFSRKTKSVLKALLENTSTLAIRFQPELWKTVQSTGTHQQTLHISIMWWERPSKALITQKKVKCCAWWMGELIRFIKPSHTALKIITSPSSP